MKNKLFLTAICTIYLGTAISNTKSNSVNEIHQLVTLRIITADDIASFEMRQGLVLTTKPTSTDGGFTWHNCAHDAKGINYNVVVYTDGVNIIGWDHTEVD